MKIAKLLPLAALLGLSIVPPRLATAQTGQIKAELVILAPAPSGSEVTTKTCPTATTCTTVIVRN